MSTPPEGFHDATAYLQVQPTFGRRWSSGEYVETITGLKVVGMTQERPRKPKGGTITTKVTLRIPDGALLPFAPQAIITVPEGHVITNPIEVIAEDPSA